MTPAPPHSPRTSTQTRRVAVAAVLFRKLPPGIERAGVVLSGGNVDPETLARVAQGAAA